MICANAACRQEHRGPREAFDAHHEMARTLMRAAEMATCDAREFMRINFLRLGLEMSGFCPECVIDAQRTVAVLLQTDTQQQAVADKLEELKDRAVHVCKVLPLFKKVPDFYSEVRK